MTDCARKNKWWRGCKFEARYDSKLPDRVANMKNGQPETIEALKDKTYVADICVTCGKTIKRGT